MNIYFTDNYSNNNKFEMTRYRCQNLAVVYCSEGDAYYRVGKKEWHIEKDCFLAIPPETEFSRIKTSPDFKMDIIQFGKDILIRITDEISRNLLDYFINYSPIQKVEGERAKLARDIIAYVKTLVTAKTLGYNGHIILEYFKILLYEACNNVLEQMSTLNRYTHAYSLWREFVDLIKLNYKEHHEVNWYAEQMGISAKHLSKVVSKVTKIKPSEWINESLIDEAMRLLRETDRPVKEIAFDLNFSSPSHFAQFFKKIVLISPKDYRENLYTIYNKKDSPIKFEIIREQGDPNLHKYPKDREL